MFLERIESEGIAHYSYIVGDGGDAAVIDPRRDVAMYLDVLEKHGARLRWILETHRNEDYLVGSTMLGSLAGAEVWHADGQFAYTYGKLVEDGQRWRVGGLDLQALHTPGHTPGHMAYVLREEGGRPWMLFSGDSLFAGDVGRTDLMGATRIEEETEALYRSIQERIVGLGRHVLLWPAHGPGSACGGSIADRPYTTIGLEMQLTPQLCLNGEEFVRRQALRRERPPYFLRMEARNLRPGGVAAVPHPVPLSPREFAGLADGTIVLDTRMPPGFLAAHVPDALSIWEAGLGKWAGWFLPDDRPILLVTENDHVMPAVLTLTRMGFDRVHGYLQGGMSAWHAAGYDSDGINAASVPDARRMLDFDAHAHLLDVRTPAEQAEGIVPGAETVPLAELGDRFCEVPTDARIYIFCGSGLRSTVAASVLARMGWDDLTVVLGGMEGWLSGSMPAGEDPASNTA